MDNSKSTNTIYYGVYTPGDNKDLNGSPNVFEDKNEALKVAKKNKKSRFKAFQFYHEAVEFAQNGSEFPNNNITFNGSPVQKNSTENAQMGEKASPFKGPKPQELVEFRKLIEVGDYESVRQMIWQNPRFLVSSGDTPSILQEGARYNALHIAAKSKNADIVDLILNTITDVEFIKLLYGDDSEQNAQDRTIVLLDLYLNTPNKALNETPLHFASKHGAADVVEVLVSYPQCDKTLRNKFHKTPEQIICERADGHDVAAAKRKIELLLQENYYVPVLRADDKSIPPLIGEPFSPTEPPILNKNPLSPRLEIHAYAGPMDKRGAQEFRKVWKTPPRNCSSSKHSEDISHLSSLRFKDPDKGLERIGKKLANKYEVNWKEYWPFLGSFVDISSEEGLSMFENYLKKRNEDCNDLIVEEHKKSSLSQVILNTTISPISDLCNTFSSCKINDSFDKSLDKKSTADSINYIDKACQVFANRFANDILTVLNNEDGISQTLETEIKQLELLITSYMDDGRFPSVNFQKIHCRLGTLIGQKLFHNTFDDIQSVLFLNLRNKIEHLLDNITKSVDCFSSDDESHNFRDLPKQKKPTLYRKQLICLIHYVLHTLSQNTEYKNNGYEDILKEWEDTEACACVYHIRKSKKTSLSRNGSFKGFFSRYDGIDGVSKRLFFEHSATDQILTQNGMSTSKSSVEEYSSDDDSIDEDKFYTPPLSPQSEEEFDDTELPTDEIFIGGDFPTKVDCDTFNALNLAEVKLDYRIYPNIYKWHHRISLYTDEERRSWPNLEEWKKGKVESPDMLFQYSPNRTPSKSWMRVTGVNSPKALFRSNSVR